MERFLTPFLASLFLAHAMKGDREHCLAAGMDGYLSKPISGHELIALVETLAAGAPSVAADPVSSTQAEEAPAAASLRSEWVLRRSKAEQRLYEGKTRPASLVSETDARALVHELQVYQIELEMQNEELQRVQAAAQNASERFSDLFDFAPVAYFLWDRHGRILEVNLAGAALLGLNRDTVIHKRFGQFVAMQDRVRFADFCARVLATDIKQTCAILILQSGQSVEVQVEGIATRGYQGQERLCRAAVIGISRFKPGDKLAATNHAVNEIRAPETAISPAEVVFDPELALARCCGSQEMVPVMIKCFFDDVDDLLPKMRVALEKSDLEEVGQLGHRMKGTVVYLGAKPAEKAVLRVERVGTCERCTPIEAREAVDSLEHACIALKAALSRHPPAAGPLQGDSP